MSASYLDQIDQQLAVLNAEIERLQIAREVIAKLEGRSKPVLNLKAEPSPSTKSGPFTIRKISAGNPEKSTGKKTRNIPVVPTPEIRARVMAGLQAYPDGVRAADLGRAIDLGSEEQLKRIWYVLSIQIEKGTVKKEDGLYRLVAAPEASEEATDGGERSDDLGRL
jgi:hypothetical protein